MTSIEKKSSVSNVPVIHSQTPSASPLDRLFGEDLLGQYELMLPTVATMRRMMDSLFERVMLPGLRERFGAVPQMDVYEKDGGYVLECAVPGFKKENVKVEVSGNSLTLSGTMAEEKTSPAP
ncbi:MAG: Hsp20/alpha crystallin family protein [Vulcanimicrobiaceae bacterium]